MTDPYCCPQHALCDVDIPGPDGAHARAQYVLFCGTVPSERWCGSQVGSHGGRIVPDRRGDLTEWRDLP